jgi:thioredoxin-related protein
LQPQPSFAQIKTFPFEQIDSLQKKEKRNILVFIHTDWCRYCQAMKNTTFKKDNIIDILNKFFYFIHFNAEDKRNIPYNNHIFKYKPTGTNTGINELAEQLGTVDNKLSFPTLCFLNADNEIIFQYPHYINSTDLKTILTRLH